MGKYKILLYLVALGINCALTMYYACPPTSVCVPPKNCKPENVTFNTTSDKNDQEFKYICGILAQCEGHVCCNDPINLPLDFEPNKTQWCYSEESFVDPLKIDVEVYPYPGLEEPQPKENMLHIDTLCPAGSICVAGSMCPLQYISYSYGFSGDEFKCGSHPGSIGNICCTISGIFEPMFKVPHTKPHFMKKRKAAVTKRESRWSFMNSDYFPSNNVVMKKQKLYKEVSGKSTKPQEWVCGRTLSIAQELNRIYAPVGDREAKEGDYPWHVAILSSSSYKYLCSGVIISEKTVVTIAHCFNKHHSASDVLIRVGDLNLQLDTEKNPAFDVRVKHLVIHPNYNEISLDADIAIIEMEESVRSLPHVKPVCLPHRSFSPIINQCKVPGWGQFSKSKEEKNEFNYALRAASFYVIDNTQCQNSLRKVKELGAFFKLQKRVLCAKGYSNADTCKGDGGSGLVCRDKDVYVLKGLVSYGFGCGLNLPGVYTDVEKYLDFINNYKKFIPTSSSDFSSTYVEQNFSHEKPEISSSKISTSDVDGTYTNQKFYSQEKLSSSGHKVSSADIDSTYTEHKLYFPEEQKYISDLESEDKTPVYITIQDEKNQPAYITIQGETTDQSKQFHGSSKNYVDKSPVKIDYTNQFTQISSPYETLEDGEYTYIKVQEPEYIERPKFSPNLYEPEEKVNFYTQSSIKDSLKYEGNFLPSSYEFSNSRDDSNYISKSEYKSEKSQYDDEEKSFENTYKPNYNREGYSDRTDALNYNSRPNYNKLDYSTLNNFGEKLSYKPDHTRLIEDTFHQPDYARLNEDTFHQPDYLGPNEGLSYQPEYKTNEGAFYQPNYIKPKEEKLSYQKDYERTKDTIYQPDYTRPNEDVLSYEPDYTLPNEGVLSYEPDYTRPNEDLLSYESDYTRSNEDVLSYEPDYTRPNEDVLSYEPEYKTNDDRFYRPNKSPYEDGILYQPDYTRSDYPIQSDQLDYEALSFNYLPANNLERYNAPEENYKGSSRPTNYYTPQDGLYYEDLDHLRYGRGLKHSSRISPKIADVKTYSKKVSGKASGESGNILSVFSSDSSVRRGKVVSPLAMLKRKFWVK